MNINPIIERRGPARLSDADYRELEANLELTLSPPCSIAMTATPRTVGELRALLDGLDPETRLVDQDSESPVVTLLYGDGIVCHYVEIGQ